MTKEEALFLATLTFQDLLEELEGCLQHQNSPDAEQITEWKDAATLGMSYLLQAKE